MEFVSMWGNKSVLELTLILEAFMGGEIEGTFPCTCVMAFTKALGNHHCNSGEPQVSSSLVDRICEFDSQRTALFLPGSS